MALRELKFEEFHPLSYLTDPTLIPSQDNLTTFSFRYGDCYVELTLGNNLESTVYTKICPNTSDEFYKRVSEDQFNILIEEFEAITKNFGYTHSPLILDHLERIRGEMQHKLPNSKVIDPLKERLDALADEEVLGIVKSKPFRSINIHGLQVNFRGVADGRIVRDVLIALREFHRNELRRIGTLGVNIFDWEKVTNRVVKMANSKVDYHWWGADFASSAHPRNIFIGTGRENKVSAIMHEIGHVIDFTGNLVDDEANGTAHHFRTHVKVGDEKGYLADLVHNLYSAENAGEWFAEAWRLMASKNKYVPFENIDFGYSTQDEFAQKDLVGYLVFKKYFQLLDANHPKPETAFSMTAFHDAREFVLVGNGNVKNIEYEWAGHDVIPLAEAHIRQGNNFFSNRRFAKAAASYSNALAIIPEYVHARHCLANSLLKMGRQEEAKAEYERLCVDDPYEATQWLKLAGLYEGNNQWQKSFKIYTELAKKFPDDPEYLAKKLYASAMSFTHVK